MEPDVGGWRNLRERWPETMNLDRFYMRVW